MSISNKHFEVAQVGEVTIITLLDEELHENTDTIKSSILQLIDQGHHKLIMDFSHLNFMGSKCVGMLVALRTHLLEQTGKKISGPPVAQKVYFPIYKDRDSALAVLEGSGDGGCILFCCVKPMVEEIFLVCKLGQLQKSP